ncbi:phosphoesterase family-domain-containing protein [Dipodascopsis uninucleata]
MKFSCSFAAVSLAMSGMGALAQSSSAYLTPVYSTVEPSATEIFQVQATAVPGEMTSSVSGKAFDRFIVIWLENIDYDAAASQSDLAYLTQYGILLENYFSLTHPSEPNYIAAVGGDYFGMDSDDFFRIPSNVSNIVDLLDTKGISWAEYQEHSPYPGFEGFNFSNQDTFANDYVRKHNPLVIYDNVANNATRLKNIKNFTDFYNDLENEKLPQWMFITPNMTNDGHDTTVDVAGAWTRSFLTPLMNNSYFMDNTLVLVTFDESETYTIQNHVFALLLGGAVPDDLKNTTDSGYYNHYSELSTVEANWDLPHLGRGDFDANPFSIVADAADITVQSYDFSNVFNNKSRPGFYNDDTIPIPPPNVTAINRNGRPILDSIKSVWAAEYSSVASTEPLTDAEPLTFSVAPSSTSSVDATLTTSVATTATSDSTSTSVSSSSASATSSSAAAAGVAAPITGVIAGLGMLLAIF